MFPQCDLHIQWEIIYFQDHAIGFCSLLSLVETFYLIISLSFSFCLFFSFQTWKVKSGSHSVQQQPVLQGQPFPLQVEYTTSKHDWWEGGQDTADNPLLEVEGGVPRGCGRLALCAVTSEYIYPEERTDT